MSVSRLVNIEDYRWRILRKDSQVVGIYIGSVVWYLKCATQTLKFVVCLKGLPQPPCEQENVAYINA